MKTLANILRGNWTLILAVGVLVGIVALNGGCDDRYGQDFWGGYDTGGSFYYW